MYDKLDLIGYAIAGLLVLGFVLYQLGVIC